MSSYSVNANLIPWFPITIHHTKLVSHITSQNSLITTMFLFPYHSHLNASHARWSQKENNVVVTFSSSLYIFTYIQINLVDVQSFAWERWASIFAGKVLLYRTSLQFFMVCDPRILLLNTHKHIMGVLDILQVSHCSATRLRHERLRIWCTHTWLDCCSIIPVQPSYLTLLCYCQCLCTRKLSGCKHHRKDLHQ